METTNCLVCDSDDSSLFLEKESFSIVKCSKCTMVYVNPRLTLEELEEFYNADYYHGYIDSFVLDVARKRAAINWIRKYKSGGKLLDIGCSVGSMLEAGTNYFEVSGVEPASWSCLNARERGFSVFHGSLEQAQFADNSFDVVTFTEVIEHMHKPIDFLKEVNRILKQDGVLYLTTGNVDSYRARKEGSNWSYYEPTYHLGYFSPSTIRLALQKAGFKVVPGGLNGRIPFKGMIPLWKFYENKIDFIKGCISKLPVLGIQLGDMGVIAQKA